MYIHIFFYINKIIKERKKEKKRFSLHGINIG